MKIYNFLRKPIINSILQTSKNNFSFQIEKIEIEYNSLDYYSLLNIKTDSSLSEIKRSYYKLLKLFHPDKYKGNPNIVKRIIEAYKVLSNPVTREVYNKKHKFGRKIRKNEDLNVKFDRQTVKNEERNKDESKFKSEFEKLDLEMIRHRFNQKKIYSKIENIKVYKTDLEKSMNEKEYLKKEFIDDLHMKDYKKRRYFFSNLVESFLNEINPNKNKERIMTYAELLKESGFTFKKKTKKEVEIEKDNVKKHENEEKLYAYRFFIFLGLVFVGGIALIRFRSYKLDKMIMENIEKNAELAEKRRIDSLY